MRKFFLSTIVLFFVLSGVSAHPLHLSIINVSIEGTVMSVTISTFVDDWETSYFHYFSKPADLTLPENYKGEWFMGRLEASLQIREKEDDDSVKLTVDNIMFDELSMTIEMHGKLKKTPKSLYIYNAILTDIFPDQTNLVIVSLNNKETGMKFDYKTKQKELKLR